LTGGSWSEKKRSALLVGCRGRLILLLGSVFSSAGEGKGIGRGREESIRREIGKCAGDRVVAGGREMLGGGETEVVHQTAEREGQQKRGSLCRIQWLFITIRGGEPSICL